MKHKILVVVAHPDDEVLGCGGTIARLSSEGHRVYVLILSRGITSRYDAKTDDVRKKQQAQMKRLESQAQRASSIIGVDAKDLRLCDFPDNEFDTVPLLDIIKVIEKAKDHIKPHIILTHYGNDLNIDHQITYKAVITAAQPQPDEVVKEIYSFNVPSSTEWSYPLDFSPNTFFELNTEHIRLKREAMKAYKSEIRSESHPRSISAITLLAKVSGINIGTKHTKNFQCIRRIV